MDPSSTGLVLTVLVSTLIDRGPGMRVWLRSGSESTQESVIEVWSDGCHEPLRRFNGERQQATSPALSPSPLLTML